jgi:renalase
LKSDDHPGFNFARKTALPMNQNQFEVAVIGAGIAGLTCAQQLAQAGYRVVVLEKSRGLGGRMATRRLQGTWADHGARYLELKPNQPNEFHQLVQALSARGIIVPWGQSFYHLSESGLKLALESYPRYVAPLGMSAIAKYLAQGLEIRLNQRVIGLHLSEIATYPNLEINWQIVSESAAPISAASLVIAIPAPQALDLCEPLAAKGLAPEFVRALQDATYAPCLSVIAGYPEKFQSEVSQLGWQAIEVIDDPILDWVGVDSSKRTQVTQPIMVLQSTAAFAKSYLESTELDLAGQAMLNHAGQHLLPWLAAPSWLQVHRWRYAFPRNLYPAASLQAPMQQLLICCGDWCGGNSVADALKSGLAAADRLNDQLDRRSLPGI